MDNAVSEERDHRKIGRELDLFVFSDLVGPGLPLWTPRGTVLRQELDRFVQEMRDKHGFSAVTIPHITKKELYEASGHWAKFSDDLFKVASREGHEFALKPMNCPHHSQIYASQPRSYKDLPIRYRETTMNYRDEQTGELNGILRTRAFTQDDAHVFCRADQISAEVSALWEMIERFYSTLDFELALRFSQRDPASPDAYSGDEATWQLAEAELQKVVESKKPPKVLDGKGEAAFYGPKLDFMATDSLGREWQVATVQLDFAQPEGLGLTYVDEQNAQVRPVMIHCAVMGSIERFLAVYLEHCEGKFPLWLAPEQLRIITINNEENILQFANTVVNTAKENNLRANLDDSNESVSKKILNAEQLKVPYVLVVGPKEVDGGSAELRSRSDLAERKAGNVDQLLEDLALDAKARK